jgi:HEAT repeat protein
MELSSHDDPESLRTILGGLTSPEPGIRKAALAATRQFGSRDAIPYLQEAAAHTDEPREKVAILDAIEYLKMPSLTELRETARKSGG